MKKRSLLFLLGLFSLIVPMSLVLADVVPTSVTVGNSAPAFTVAVAESIASPDASGHPTPAGSGVVFTATATDGSGENYYLAICKTNAITPVNGGAPTCPGGSWAISSAISSGAMATTSYTTQNGDDEVNVWYAFVCDGNATSALCSASSQGSGISGSPFEVNHRPTFTSASNDGPVDPGDDITFSAVASDIDVNTAADTVALLVCKTAGVNHISKVSIDCDGGLSDQWCRSTSVASDPSCVATMDSVVQDGSYDAYVYLYDSHFHIPLGAPYGSNSSFSVSDVSPVVSSVTLNGGSDITLTEGSTTAISVTATVSDDNSCQDLTGVTTSVYRSGITYAGCDIGGEANANNCYAVVSCSVSGGSCTGATDGSADYTCSISMQYHADPTDTTTEYTAQNWLATVVGTDSSQSGSTEIGTGVEVLSLVGYDTSGSISYGSLTVGQSNDPLDKITTISATGNVGLDIEVSGSDLCTDFPTCVADTIGVGNQEYALAGSTAYGAGIDLSGTETEAEINIAKTTVTASDESGDVYWGLLIPGGTIPGSYTGSNTITALKGEVGEW